MLLNESFIIIEFGIIMDKYHPLNEMLTYEHYPPWMKKDKHIHE
jgi:hypothetical protein